MEVMQEVVVFAGILVGIVIALVEMVKITLVVPKNLIPLIGFILGLIVALAAYPFTDLPWDVRLWAGAIAGLSATGLFELVFKNRPGTTRYK
jgi:hypothetical protein